ncbi:hypothetical protein EDD16DRAFT_1528901 [Pisolithus croceorrhizus]|nr:hypothetical protein EDD16DRAFT_1528901 [Pisolithus croceorrhizus]
MPFPTPCNLGLSRFPPDAPPIAPAGSMELANVQPVSATPVEDPQVNQGGLPAGPPAEQPVGPGSVRSSISVLTLYMILTLGLISSDLALLQMNLIVLSTTKVPMTTTASSWDPGTFHKNYIVPFHQFKVGEDILHQHASMFPGPQFGQCCGTSEPNSLCGVWIVTICSLVHQAFMSSASSVPLHSIIHFILLFSRRTSWQTTLVHLLNIGQFHAASWGNGWGIRRESVQSAGQGLKAGGQGCVWCWCSRSMGGIGGGKVPRSAHLLRPRLQGVGKGITNLTSRQGFIQKLGGQLHEMYQLGRDYFILHVLKCQTDLHDISGFPNTDYCEDPSGIGRGNGTGMDFANFFKGLMSLGIHPTHGNAINTIIC